MAWEPDLEQLGTVTETQVFSFSVKYFQDIVSGEEGGVSTPVYYPVKITAVEANPATVVITNGTLDSTISGSFGPAFDDIVTYMKNDLSYETLDTLTTPPPGTIVWTKLASRPNKKEIISFIPDPTRMRIFNYTCVAGTLDGSGNIPSPIATTNKQIILDDRNWTPGKNALQAAVAETGAA